MSQFFVTRRGVYRGIGDSNVGSSVSCLHVDGGCNESNDISANIHTFKPVYMSTLFSEFHASDM